MPDIVNDWVSRFLLAARCIANWKVDCQIVKRHRYGHQGYSSIPFCIAVWLFPVFAFAQTDWPRFRGQRADGHVAEFPQKPFQPRMLWETPLPAQGVGGVAATEEFVIASSRSDDDQQDVFVCMDAVTGAVLWKKMYPAPGQLDYGNSPRATPLISDPWVYLVGAMGDLICVDIDSAEVKWQKHLVRDLGGLLPTWGYGWSPLLVEDRLIVMPGGPASSIAALNPETGDVLWRTGGHPTAYASPLLAQWKNKQQIVAYDKSSLGGWDLQTGQRLWTIQPAKPNDFNVPTPLILPDCLVVVTENNGLRQYMIDPATGFPRSEPAAQVPTVSTDSHTPVSIGQTIIAAERELVAMDSAQQLKIQWRIKDRGLRGHCSLIASDQQVLVIAQGGDLFLVQTDSHEKTGQIVGRHKFTGARHILAHPALAGEVLYLRAETSLQAWALWK